MGEHREMYIRSKKLEGRPGWKVKSRIHPDEVHHALERRLPKTWLHVSSPSPVLEVVGPGSALLSSSILQSLRTGISGLIASGQYWRGVKNPTSSCRNVKIFHIRGRRGDADYFPFEEGDVWPPLEETRFDHCNMDQAVMNKHYRFMD